LKIRDKAVDITNDHFQRKEEEEEKKGKERKSCGMLDGMPDYYLMIERSRKKHCTLLKRI